MRQNVFKLLFTLVFLYFIYFYFAFCFYFLTDKEFFFTFIFLVILLLTRKTYTLFLLPRLDLVELRATCVINSRNFFFFWFSFLFTWPRLL